MDLFELGGQTEEHPAYQGVKAANDLRHYDFLYSMIRAALEIERPLLSQAIIKAINFHAIAGLHYDAGEYRSVGVKAGDYEAPHHTRVKALMDDFVNVVNLQWLSADTVGLASFALWRLNHIHPFVNGNGRTARAVCYFILCVKSGGLLPGTMIVPEKLKARRQEYLQALRKADEGDLNALTELVRKLTLQQIEDDGVVHPSP